MIIRRSGWNFSGRTEKVVLIFLYKRVSKQEFCILARNNCVNLLKISKALADGTRYKILLTLIERGEISCGELESHFKLSQPTISHHLKILYNCQIISAYKAGQHSLLSVNKKILRKYLQTVENELLR